METARHVELGGWGRGRGRGRRRRGAHHAAAVDARGAAPAPPVRQPQVAGARPPPLDAAPAPALGAAAPLLPRPPALEAGRPTYVVRRLPNPKYQITSPCDVCVPLVVSLEFPSLMYCFALSLNFVLKLKVHLNELKSVSIILFLYNIF